MLKSSRIGFVVLTALGVDLIIGMGIYTLPGKVFAHLGWHSYLVFPICGLLLSVIALNLSILASTASRNGATYIYLRQIGLSKTGFAMGWVNWAGATLGMGVFANVFGQIFVQATGLDTTVTPIVALSTLLLMNLGNCIGVRIGGFFIVAFTAFKLVPLVILAVAGLLEPGATIVGHSLASSPTPGQWTAAVVLALFVCQGFENIPIVAGECNAPQRVIPRSVVASLWVAVVLYTTLFMGMNPAIVSGSAQPLQLHAASLFGELGGTLVGVFALMSVLGLLAGRALTAPRLLTPLCEDGLLPKAIARRHPKFGTPMIAIAVSFLCSAPFTFVTNLESFIGLASLGVALNYFIVCAINLFVTVRLRRRDFALPILGICISMFFLCIVPGMAWLQMLVILCGGYAVKFLSESRNYSSKKIVARQSHV